MNASNRSDVAAVSRTPVFANGFLRAALVLATIGVCAVIAAWSSGLDLRALSQHGADDAQAALLWCATGALSGALLAGVFWMVWFENRAAVERLAGNLEAPRTEAGHAPLAEFGPQEIVRLIRAINARSARDAERVAEQLNAQAECAHDMRGPIARIGLRCERLLDSDLRARIERDLAELNSLVESSLVFARALHGTPEPMQRIDVDGLLASLIGDYEDVGRTIEVVGRVGQPVMTCPRSLRRVLTNLIDNALRHGGGARLSACAESQRLVLAVLDDGPGVPPAQLEAIFRPWVQAAGPHAPKAGTGLGLAIARRLAMSFNGELHARNRVDGGFEAALTLPMAVR